MQACLDLAAVSQLYLVIAKQECELHGTIFVVIFFFLRKTKTWVLRAQSVKYSPANAGTLGLTPRTGRYPREENGNPCQFFLSGKCHGQRSLAGYQQRHCKTAGHNLAPKQQNFKRNIEKTELLKIKTIITEMKFKIRG